MLKRTYRRLIDEAIDYEKNADRWLARTNGVIHVAMEDDSLLEDDIRELINYRIHVYEALGEGLQ